MRYSSRRLVLRNSVADADIWAFAKRKGWRYLGHVPRDPERGVFYEARWDLGEENLAHFIIDEFADVLYMVVQHHDPQAAEDVARQIETGLPVDSLAHLAENFDVNMYPAGWAKALLRLAVGAPLSLDEEVRIRIHDSVGHRDARVRMATVWAIRYTAWPELHPILEQMERSETDPDVAQEIARTTEAFAAKFT
ncbi:hypothetical protein [Actinomadura rudentiformis]|uniref:HEAT repeat domain-containing protein n=1 Tax=Actinomadura rudentiformis TaxID=359158 RepID=A0A6H9YPM4_9ACTN|nr:hypothetical protein [Actinomadura rudentiformis]KAB2346926.1 hypothetical protein F8566_22295 [Actinomadura rudentiformis]